MSQQNKIIAAVAAALIIAVLGFVVSGGGGTASVETETDNSANSQAAAASGDALNDIAAAIKAAEASNAGALETPNPLGEIMMGKADAPVTIVEYSSLTCPHCGAFHRDTLP